MFNSVSKDLSFAFRQLTQSEGFTLTAVLTLALGIGATLARIVGSESPPPWLRAATVAGLAPATRAGSIDPMKALRTQAGAMIAL